MSPKSDRGPIRLSIRAFLGLLAWLLAPWLLVAVLFFARETEVTLPTSTFANAPASARSLQGSPGPWGQLHFTRIAIEPPSDLIAWQDFAAIPLRWYFGGLDLEQVRNLFMAADLPPEVASSLLNTAKVEPGGVWITPTPEQVLGLRREARQMIYFPLARHPENIPQRWAFSMRPAFLEERFSASGLKPEVLRQLSEMFYPHGDLLLFADANVMLPLLPTDDERMRLIKALSRKRAILATLAVRPGMDVENIVDYWSAGVRSKDVRPLIESLARVPGGSSVDLVHLLPQFARRRLNSFPRLDQDPAAAKRDCHWTSLNFYNAAPDDSFLNPSVAMQHIRENYFFIAAQPRLGDLVLLSLPDGMIVHSAVYVADDLVFTKNGPVFTQPWLLMPLPDMVEFHSAFYPPDRPLQVLYCRKRTE